MIFILDNGSQYTHLIKRNCRDLGFEAEIINNKTVSYAAFGALLKKNGLEKVILSGGPSSVTSGDNGLSEHVIRKLLAGEIDVPLLGICFGHQLLAHVLGGKVEKGKSAEYGISRITIDDEDALFAGVPNEINAWVSHFDEVKRMPEGFVSLAHSKTCDVEAMRHRARNVFGVQFHPEVWHTEHGEKILENFLKI